MRSGFTTVAAVIAVLIAIVALWMAMSARKEAAGASERGNQRPNIITAPTA